MKKLLLVFAIAAFVACNDSGNPEEGATPDSTTNAAPPPAPAPDSTVTATPDSTANAADTLKK